MAAARVVLHILFGASLTVATAFSLGVALFPASENPAHAERSPVLEIPSWSGVPQRDPVPAGGHSSRAKRSLHRSRRALHRLGSTVQAASSRRAAASGSAEIVALERALDFQRLHAGLLRLGAGARDQSGWHGLSPGGGGPIQPRTWLRAGADQHLLQYFAGNGITFSDGVRLWKAFLNGTGASSFSRDLAGADIRLCAAIRVSAGGHRGSRVGLRGAGGWRGWRERLQRCGAGCDPLRDVLSAADLGRAARQPPLDPDRNP